MTTLNIRSDPMATWECAKQVQASPKLLRKRNACALHFRLPFLDAVKQYFTTVYLFISILYFVLGYYAFGFTL